MRTNLFSYGSLEQAQPPARLRSFVALPLSDAVIAELGRAIERLREQPGGRRIGWVRPANLHLTLRFLAEVEAARLPELRAELAEAVASVTRFELRLGELGLFPSPRHPRVVAAGVEGGAPLEQLVRAVEAAVVACGLLPESRGFRAHLTLGRFRERCTGSVQLEASLARIAMPVTRVVLYRSVVGPGGAHYSELASFELAA